MKRLLLALSVALLNCQGELALNDVADGEHAQEIVGGSPTSGEPNVFYLLGADATTGREKYICTATLISSRTLLTAAHCVGRATLNFVPKYTAGNSAQAPGAQPIGVTKVLMHPSYQDLGEVVPHDMALVLLDQAPQGVTPAKLPTKKLGNLMGLPLRVVGYGLTSAVRRDSGTKRVVNSQVTPPITPIFPSNFSFGTLETEQGAHGICGGDSGGPSFAQVDGEELLVGVHSWGVDAACGWGVDTRVDDYVSSFITPFLEANDPLPRQDPALSRAQRLEFQPENREVRGIAGQVFNLQMKAFDGNNRVVPLNGSEWTVSANAGMGNATVRGFSVTLATRAGDFPNAIQFRKDDVSTSFRVVIEPSTATTLEIERPSEMQPGETIQLQVKATDAFGNDLSHRVTWKASGGVVSNVGAFTAPKTPGNYEVSASLEGLHHAVQVTVVAVGSSPALSPANMADLPQKTDSSAVDSLGESEASHLIATSSCNQAGSEMMALHAFLALAWGLRRLRRQ